MSPNTCSLSPRSIQKRGEREGTRAKRGEGEVGRGGCIPKHLVHKKHHLTFPLLRNGPLPLPRFVAERRLRCAEDLGLLARTAAMSFAAHHAARPVEHYFLLRRQRVVEGQQRRLDGLD